MMDNKGRRTAAIQESGRGTIILVLGILSIVMFGPLSGIPAWVMANTDLRKIDAGIIPASERTTTRAGKILGIIGTFLVFGIILLGIFMVVGINLVAPAS